jgi:hypothetical protein
MPLSVTRITAHPTLYCFAQIAPSSWAVRFPLLNLGH